MHLKHLCIPALLLVVTSGFSQSLSNTQRNALTNILSQYSNPNTPGIAVGMVQEGALVYEVYTGYANLEHEVPIDSQTRFNIASNAKQFTALCILELAGAGQLALDDDIRKYVPEVYPHLPEKITIAHVLNHTSGLRDVYDLWALKGQTWWQLFVDNNDAMELLTHQTELNFSPGTQYSYSNSNYIVLTEILQKVTGIPFAAYAKSRFQSWGMSHTEFQDQYMKVIPHKARPYGDWNGWKEYPAVTGLHGDGGLFTTLRDQLHWEMILQQNDTIILPETLLRESQQLLKNSTIKNYGFGVMFAKYKGKNLVYHDGNTGAYNATFLRFPEEKTAIVVLSNNGNVSTHTLAKELADIILELSTSEGDYPSGPKSLAPAFHPNTLIGTYRQQEDPGSLMYIFRKNDTLYRRMYQRDAVALLPEKGSLYHYANNPALKMAFQETTSGNMGFTIYMSSQAPIVYEKLSYFEATTYDKGALAGTYYNKETQTTIVLKHLSNTTFLLTKNGKERQAELAYRDFLRMNSYQIYVSRDAKGTITGLRVNNGRVLNVWFQKMNNGNDE